MELTIWDCNLATERASTLCPALAESGFEGESAANSPELKLPDRSLMDLMVMV